MSTKPPPPPCTLLGRTIKHILAKSPVEDGLVSRELQAIQLQLSTIIGCNFCNILYYLETQLCCGYPKEKYIFQQMVKVKEMMKCKENIERDCTITKNTTTMVTNCNERLNETK